MRIDDKIEDEKFQYDINREAAKLSALSSGKTDKYEYLTGEEILTSNQRQIVKQAKFAYCPLEKQTEKQVSALRSRGTSNKKSIKTNLEYISTKSDVLVCAKLKKMVNLQDIIKTDELHFKLKPGKVCDFTEFSLPIIFLEISMKNIYH